MFPSIYLNCSDDPQACSDDPRALFPHLKKLLLFTEEVHIMNPNPDLLEERAGIKPGDFVTLCNCSSDGEQAPPIRPICRHSFIDREARKARVDLEGIEFNEQFFGFLSSVCSANNRLLGEDSYEDAHAITKRRFERLGEDGLEDVRKLTKRWIDEIPKNRRERFLSFVDEKKVALLNGYSLIRSIKSSD